MTNLVISDLIDRSAQFLPGVFQKPGTIAVLMAGIYSNQYCIPFLFEDDLDGIDRNFYMEDLMMTPFRGSWIDYMYVDTCENLSDLQEIFEDPEYIMGTPRFFTSQMFDSWVCDPGNFYKKVNPFLFTGRPLNPLCDLVMNGRVLAS